MMAKTKPYKLGDVVKNGGKTYLVLDGLCWLSGRKVFENAFDDERGSVILAGRNRSGPGNYSLSRDLTNETDGSDVLFNLFDLAREEE
jgi:hypothetical protein